ncbi:uncharacterized protein LOC110026928 [Phalaenopsis equestris]|uniref:uncharacterized protein LOC110026928 n=1 Tax=Phalaenopsis equestris TaxID=78828 RepID=UPI0009E281C0|nr:uncharacterized protein LOC110026928 [Phalaenopsis equestris]
MVCPSTRDWKRSYDLDLNGEAIQDQDDDEDFDNTGYLHEQHKSRNGPNFLVARASQTDEISLEDEQWNDGLLATICEKVHLEIDRKASLNESNEANMPIDPLMDAKITYRTGNKIICCLENARICIQYETSFAGDPCEIYHCVLESKLFLENMNVIQHTLSFFLPIREAENDFLSSNAIKFIDYVGTIYQAYVNRREQQMFPPYCHVLFQILQRKKWMKIAAVLKSIASARRISRKPGHGQDIGGA